LCCCMVPMLRPRVRTPPRQHSLLNHPAAAAAHTESESSQTRRDPTRVGQGAGHSAVLFAHCCVLLPCHRRLRCELHPSAMQAPAKRSHHSSKVRSACPVTPQSVAASARPVLMRGAVPSCTALWSCVVHPRRTSAKLQAAAGASKSGQESGIICALNIDTNAYSRTTLHRNPRPRPSLPLLPRCSLVPRAAATS